MNTNWSKILLFSLISFALGVIICCLCCQMWCGGGGCGRHGSCGRGETCGHGDMSSCNGGGRSMRDCGHGKGEKGGHKGKGACCSMDHGDKPGDAEADRISKELEKANFLGDTTIAIEGGEVRIVRSTDNTSVHVDMIGEEKEEHGHPR